jgi:hypothetical protein
MRRRAGNAPTEEPTEQYPAQELPDTFTDPLALLSEPATVDDLTPALAKRPRAKLPSLTMFLMALVIAGAGFYAGALVGKHHTSSGAGGFAGFRAAGTAGATGAAGTGRTGTGGAGTGGAGAGGFLGGGGTGAAGADTIGTIKLIDGNTVYVQTEAGDIVQVQVSSATKITISSSGTVKNLAPGQTVIVGGAKNSSGAVSATSVSQSSGLGAFGGG